MLGLVVLLGVFLCDALPPSIVWNQWIAQTFTGNPAYNSAPESREFALYLLAAHDGLNSVKGPGRRKYTPYVQYVDNNIHSFKSDEVIVAAAYRQMLKYTVTSRVTTDGTAYYFPIAGPGNQSYYIDLIDNFYATFVAGLSPQPTNNQKARGEALGTAAANSVWQARAGDGFNRTIPQPYVPNFQPGKWYPRPNEAQIYPLKTYEIPISLPTPYYTLVQPPPFNLDDEDYLADLRYTKDKGSKGNTTRTAAESISAQFAVILAGARYQSAMLTALYPQLVSYAGYDLRDFTRLHALISMAQADSYTSVTNHKATYQFWRPWQAITRANEWAHIFPRLAELYDPTWQSFQTTPNNPEYPAGHPTASSCFSHTLRRILGWDVFPGGSVTAIATPTIQESYNSVGEIEEKMINSRVFGGMHLRASGRVGVILGHRLVDYTVENWLLPTGGQNSNDGDDD